MTLCIGNFISKRRFYRKKFFNSKESNNMSYELWIHPRMIDEIGCEKCT